MTKVLRTRFNRWIELILVFFVAGCVFPLSCHRTQGNEAIAKKMPTILLNLVNSNNPVNYAKGHDIALKDGRVRVIIAVHTRFSSKDFLSKYDLTDYQSREDLITAYISIDELRRLCEDPAVIYVRLPVKLNGR